MEVKDKIKKDEPHYSEAYGTGVDPIQFYIPIQPQVEDMRQGTVVSENKEKERIKSRMKDFDPKSSEAWKSITQRFGNSIKQPELLSIATVVAQNANIKLDRDAKRRKAVLIKWFNENWESIKGFLEYVVLEDASHHQQ